MKQIIKFLKYLDLKEGIKTMLEYEQEERDYLGIPGKVKKSLKDWYKMIRYYILSDWEVFKGFQG